MCANNSAIDGPGSIALSCNPPSGTARSKPKSHLCVAWIEAVFIRALSRGLGAREAARDRNRAEGHLTRGCRAGNSQDRKNGSLVPLISRPTLGPETAPKNFIATRVPGCRRRVARTFLSASLVRLDAETLLIRMAEVEGESDAIFAGSGLNVRSDHRDEAGVLVREMAHVRVINITADEPAHGSASYNI